MKKTDIVITNKEIEATTSSVNVEGDLTNKPIIATLTDGDVIGSVSQADVRASLSDKALSASIDNFMLNISINGKLDKHPTLFKKIIDDILIYDVIINTLLDYGAVPNDQSLTSDIITFLADFNRDYIENISSEHLLVFEVDKANEEYISNFEIISKFIEMSFGDLVTASESFNAVFDFQGLFQNPVDNSGLVESFLSVLVAQRTLQDNLSLANYVSFDASKVLSDLSTSTDTLALHPSKVLSDTSTTSEALNFAIGLSLNDILNISENLTLAATGNSSYDSSDTSTSSETITFTWSALRTFLETVAQTEVLSFGVNKTINDISNTSEVVTAVWTALLDRQDTSTHVDMITFGISPEKLEYLTLQETVELLWNAQYSINDNLISAETFSSFVNKLLSDNVTSLEELQKSISSIQSEDVIGTETISFNSSVIFSDLVNLVEDFTPAFQGSGDYSTSDTSALTENLTLQWTAFYSLTENSTLTETLDKNMSIYLSNELVSLSETIIKEMGYGLLFNDTASQFETLIFDASKVSNENLVSSEDISKSISNVLSDTSTTSDTLSTLWTILPTYNDNIISSEVTSVSVNKVFNTENTALTETFTLTLNNAYSELVSSTETLNFNASINFSENILTSENIAKSIADDRWDDDLTNVSLNEIFTRTWTITRDYQENLAVTDVFEKAISNINNENITGTETVDKSFGKVIQDNPTLTEIITTNWVAQFDAYEYPLTSESYLFNIGKNVSENTLTSETFSPVWTAQFTLTDLPILSEIISKDASTVYTDLPLVSEVINKTISPQFNETPILSEIINKDASTIYTDLPLVSEVINKTISPQFNETSNSSETFILSYVKELSETIALTEAFVTDLVSGNIDKLVEDFLNLSEEISKLLDTFVSENLTTSEVSSNDVSKNIVAGTSATDDFTGADGTLSSNWVDLYGSDTVRIESNQLRATPFRYGGAQWNGSNATFVDCVFEIDVNLNMEPGTGGGKYSTINVYLRERIDYFVRVDIFGGDNTVMRVRDYTTNLINNVSVPDSGRLKITLSGQSISVIYADVLRYSGTLPTAAAPGKASFYIDRNSFTYISYFDNFSLTTYEGEITTTSESFILDYIKNLLDEITLTETIVTDLVTSGLEKLIEEVSNITEIIDYNISKYLEETLTTTETLTEVFFKNICKGSLYVPSSSVYIQRTTNLPLSTSFTMAGWFKRTGDLSENRVIFRLGGASTRVLIRYHQPSTDYMLDNGPADDPIGDIEASTTNWTYFAMVGSSSGANGLKGYAWNEAGTLIGSWTTMTGNDFVTTQMRVGSADDGTNPHIGNVCHVRVWDVPLSQAELETEMFSLVPVKKSSLNTAFIDDGIDISGNERHWTLSGVSQNNDFPLWNQYISTNSSGDIIERTANLPSSENFTIAGWVYIPPTNADNLYAIFSLGTSTPSNALHWIYWDNSPVGDNIFRTVAEGSGGGPISVLGSAPPGAWYYVTIKATTAGVNAYTAVVYDQQGTEINGRTLTTTAFTPTVLRIGGYHNTTAYRGIDWLYAHVRVWDAYLTQSELIKEMFSLAPVRTANLNTAFSTNPSIDLSGNNRPWTTSGTVFKTNPTCPVNTTISEVITPSEVFTKNTSKIITDNHTVTESGVINLQNYIDGGYFASDFVGTNTTF